MASIASTASLVFFSHNKPCSNLNSKTATATATTNFGSQQRLSFSSCVGFSRKTKTDALVVKAEAQPINPEIRKTEAKVVDAVVVTELDKAVNPYCRCWRSGTFPLCDGSHVKHNKETGDNVGPLLLKK